MLGRASFAQALGGAIIGWNEPESLVVALTGPWGSGKSSVTNFVLEQLRALPPATRPDILAFSPWLVAGQGDVATKLLHDVRVALKRHDPSKRNQQLAHKWKEWAAALSLANVVMEAAPQVGWTFVIGGLAAIGATATFSAPVVELALRLIGALALVVGLSLKASTTIAEKAYVLFEARASARERTLDEVKVDLKRAMAERERQLVVVVDDIDRLPAAEVQLLLRAVRANADFPNLVFLLVFERDVVEKAIADQAHVDGSEYLQKIIQIPFSLPMVDRTRLQTVLFAALDEILDDMPSTVPFDTKRWGNLYFAGLQHYFRTLRDVYRYTTTVDFHLSMFRSGDAMEVNQIDLFAFEALRVFEPKLYEALPSHKQLLLGGPGHSYAYGSDRRDERIRELDTLLELARPETREAAKAVLRSVFQPVDWLAQNSAFGAGFEEGWERGLRACSDKYFDRYFLLSIPTGDVSQADVNAVLHLAGDRTKLVSHLATLRERGLLSAMLNRLEAYKEKIPLEHAVPFTTAIFDIGDGLPGSTGMFGIGADMHAARIVFWYLRRFSTMAEREEALLGAIRATTGIQIPADIVSMESRREGSQKSDYLVTEERLPEFERACAEKIRAAATSNRLAAHADLGSLLYRWQAWGNKDEPREWAQALASTPEGAFVIVRAFTRDVRSQGLGDHVVTVTKSIALKDVEAFVEAEALAASLEELNRNALPRKDAEVVAAFDRAMRHRREGKPDIGPLDLDYDDDE